MIPKKIIKIDYIFQNEYYIAGHYDFNIKLEYENNKTDEISKRYTDRRNLYKTLILKCPGCLIPNIPSKSIWLKINYGNNEQMIDRKEGITEFLTYLVKHKILRKNKYVILFFSKSNKSNDKSSKINNSSTNNDSDDEDFDFDSNINNEEKDNDNDDKKENDKNNSDDENVEPSQEFIEEYNNRKKGIVSKGKKIIGNMFNYVMSYASSNNNNEEEEEKENNKNNNNEINNVFYKKLSKEDFDFINKKSKELGENFEINEYNEKINRLNEGVKNIIQNLENISNIRKKNIHALDSIVNNDNNYRNLHKENKNKNIKINKDSNIDTYDENDDDDENCENKKINEHKNNINKIRQHCTIQRGFLNKKETTLTKIKKYQSLLDGLLDIYTRKKEHINYLGRLHSQKEEMEKYKENKGVMDPITKGKIDEIEKKLKNEIKFIKKINKDLKYEIERYKENQEDIYILINSLFKEQSNSIKNCIENLNKTNCDYIEVNEEKSNLKKIKTKESIDEKNDDDF